MRIGVLGSTRGTILPFLLRGLKEEALAAQIVVILSNNQAAPILQKARAFGIPEYVVSSEGLSREAFDTKLSSLLKSFQVDLIILMGYMRILSPSFIASWRNKVINTHPSLLPDFSGLMDLDVHRAVLEANRTITGCTVHLATEALDAGPILLQKECFVLKDDTPERLKARVQALEGELLIEVIRGFLVENA